MAIRMRRGLESELDISKAVPGEWLVSTDTKYVRMCFAPGIVLRMATYDAFEADMAKIQNILEECRDIRTAIARIQNEVNSKAILCTEYTESAKESADAAAESAERAKMYAENASAVTGVQIATQDVAGIMKGGENYIAEDGTLTLTKQTTEKTLPNSYAGGIKINGINGKSEQNNYSGKNRLEIVASTQTLNGVTFTVNANGSITVNGTATADTSLRIAGIAVPESKDTTHILSGCPSGGTANTYYLQAESVQGYFCCYGDEVSYKPVSNSYISIVVKSGTTMSNAVFYPMVSYEGGEFEPYTGGVSSPSPDYPEEIKSVVVSEIKSVGAQLLKYPYPETTKTTNGITFTDNGDGTITANGTATESAYFQLRRASDGYVDGQYYLSGDPNVSGCSIYSNTVSGTLHTAQNIGVSFPNGYGNLALKIVKGTTVNNAVIKPMLNTGNVAMPWQPYQESVIALSEPIELNGIGDSMDRIVQKDGVWGVERENVEITLDGTETINGFGNSTSFGISTYDAIVLPNNSNYEILGAYSERFIEDTPENVWIGKRDNIFAITPERVAIRLYSSLFTTQISVKEYFASNPTKFIVKRAEPTFEPLPTADQIALHSLLSYNGTTHISTDSEIEPVIDLEYGTSKVGGYTLESWNTAKRNEILYNELATAVVAGSEG